MSKTDQWGQLLQGTTPAPWYPMRHGDEFSIVHINPDRAPAEGFVGDVYGEDNARLIAAAPDLAHAVIAQAAQIKRLQAALRTASDLDTLMERGIITVEDMEGTDD